MKGAPVATSHPGMELWRSGESMSLSEAGWLGAAFGICMHAVLSFFELWMPALGAILVVFAPAERFALGLAHGAPPFMRWVVLLAALATEGALLAFALTGAIRELGAVLRRGFSASSR